MVLGKLLGAYGARKDRKAIQRFIQKRINYEFKNISKLEGLLPQIFDGAMGAVGQLSEEMFRRTTAGLPASLRNSTLVGNAARAAARQAGEARRGIAQSEAVAFSQLYNRNPYANIDPKFFGGRAGEYGALGKALGGFGDMFDSNTISKALFKMSPGL